MSSFYKGNDGTAPPDALMYYGISFDNSAYLVNFSDGKRESYSLAGSIPTYISLTMLKIMCDNIGSTCQSIGVMPGICYYNLNYSTIISSVPQLICSTAAVASTSLTRPYHGAMLLSAKPPTVTGTAYYVCIDKV